MRRVVPWIAVIAVLAAVPAAWYAATGRLSRGPVAADWRPGDPVFEAPSHRLPIQGVVYHGMWQDADSQTRARILDRYAAAGVAWVRLDVAWASLQPDGPDSFSAAGAASVDQRLEEISARGMKTLMMFWWAPAWSSGTEAKNGVPSDPEDYARALAWSVERWQDRIAAVEIWNEPDLPDYFSGSVKGYAQILRSAYPAVKAVAPHVVVVSGAPTGVNTDWYRQLYVEGGQGSFDALGIHPYVGLSDKPPDYCNQSEVRYYPCNLPNLIRLMADNGDADLPIWATEYGWSTHDNSAYNQDPRNWQRGVTPQQQADYILAMQDFLGQFPQVQAAFVYRDRDGASGDIQLDGYGLLRRDAFLTPKPGYFALKCAASGVCGPG